MIKVQTIMFFHALLRIVILSNSQNINQIHINFHFLFCKLCVKNIYALRILITLQYREHHTSIVFFSKFIFAIFAMRHGGAYFFKKKHCITHAQHEAKVKRKILWQKVQMQKISTRVSRLVYCIKLYINFENLVKDRNHW